MGFSPVLGEQARHALRRLRRAPGFALLAVGLLGLGLGVVAAAFSAMQQVVLRPLPVADQAHIAVAWTDHTVRGFDHYPVTAPLFEAAERGGLPAAAAVAAVGSYGTGQVVVELDDGPAPVEWARVLGDFFGVLGAPAEVGRALTAADDVPGAAQKVVVISHGFWERVYAASPDVVGASVRTRFGAYTIVGVMPEAFDYPRGAEVWAPTRPEYPTWDSELPRLELDLVARLQPGATLDRLSDQLGTLSRSTPELASIYEGTVPVTRRFDEHVLGDLKPSLLLLFGGGVLVLLVACLDLANIVVVRSIGERRIIAVRKALGISRSWALTESAIEAGALAVGAAVFGLLFGEAALRFVVPLAPAELTRLGAVRDLGTPARLLVVTGAIVGVAVAVVLPRWRVSRTDAGESLRSVTRAAPTRMAHLLRESVVVGQVGLAVWVLVTGALLVRTVVNLQGLDKGFDPDGLALIQLDHDRADMFTDPAEARGLAAAVERIERSNAVRAATPVQMGPLPGNGAWQTILYKEGQPQERALAENAYLFMEFVEPDFTTVLDVPVLRGRSFDESDDAAAPGALVVNESAARLYWPGDDPLGQRVRVRFPGVDDEPFTVVGVVADTRYGALTRIEPAVYFPIRQITSFGSRYLLVRTTAPGAPLLTLVREALRAEAPRYRAMSVVRVSDRLEQPLERPRFIATLLAVLAATALLITIAGTYSVMAFLVRTRRRELGVRMACGGTPANVGGLVMRRGVVIAVLGSGIGAIASTLSSGLFGSLLFGVSPADATSLVVGVGLALLCTVVACASPALQAAATDPAVVLRSE